MVIKAKFEKSNLDEVVSKLKQCASGTSALIIKNILNNYTLKEFEEFLTFRMGYLNDDRQFNLKNILDSKKWFSVYYNKNKSDVYTHSNTRQPLHNDNAWFYDPAEMVFLAFQKQAKKGVTDPAARAKMGIQEPNPNRPKGSTAPSVLRLNRAVIPDIDSWLSKYGVDGSYYD